MTQNINILKIIGIPDDNKASVVHNDGLFKQFALFFEGNSSFLEDVSSLNLSINTLHLGGAEQLQNIRLPQKPNLIMNAICDPEIQNRSLALLDDMKLADHIPMLNSTNAIRKTKRDELSQSLPLHKDFVIPKTYRITPSLKTDIINNAQKMFGSKPFLFRPATSHGGVGLKLIENYSSVNFDEYALDGREYFITEFINFRSSDGLYRKARFFIIDGKIYPRHLISSKDWKIHAGSRQEFSDDSKITLEEEHFLVSPPQVFIELCSHLHAYLKLDFFGVDCALLPDGSVILFEANVCMRPLAQHKELYLQAAQAKLEQAFTALIQKKASYV